MTSGLTRPKPIVTLLSFLLGAGYYIKNGGLGTLNPTQTDWLRTEDLSQHYLGWLFFRRAPWEWPIGHLSDLGYPVGTTVGFMDSNPLLSTLLKPFSSYMPLYTQFQGPWLLLCFALLSVSGAFVASLFTSHATGQLLVGALVMSAPPALLRVCHENLAAQWFLVIGIYGCLHGVTPLSRASVDMDPAREGWLWIKISTLLLALVITVHCYLAAMLLPLLTWAVGRRVFFDKTLTKRAGGLVITGFAVLSVAVLLVFGFIGSGISQTEPGFGSQVADVLAFINPVGWSRFLPSYAHTQDEFEGFCYLGLGNILLIVGGAACAYFRPRTQPERPAWQALFALAACYALLALSDTIWFKGQVLFSLRAWDGPLLPILGIFRASGRFLWLAHYLLILWAASAVLIRLPPKQAHLVLAGCLAVQLIDLTPQDVREKLERRQPSPLTSVGWKMIADDYRHLALYPPFFPSNRKICGDHFRWGEHLPYVFMAYEHGMTINSNYAGRADSLRIASYCRKFRQQISDGDFDPDTVYVVAPEEKGLFVHHKDMACRPVDGMLMCVRRGRPTVLSQWLALK